jgi:hypothetical protein
MVWWMHKYGRVDIIGQGESFVNKLGYRMVLDQFDRLKNEHDLVWETHNKRRLPKGHVIHHKDGDKLNNAIDNLELMTFSEHSKLHWKLRKEAKNIGAATLVVPFTSPEPAELGEK